MPSSLDFPLESRENSCHLLNTFRVSLFDILLSAGHTQADVCGLSHVEMMISLCALEEQMKAPCQSCCFLQTSISCCTSSSAELQEDAGDSSPLPFSNLAFSNSSMRRSFVLFLKQEASSGWNHLLPNYKHGGNISHCIKESLKKIFRSNAI